MFETTLITRREQDRRWRALIALPAAIIVHVAAIGVVLAAQLWVVGEVPEPVLMVAMWQAPIPPPAPPPPGNRGTTRPSRSVTPQTQLATVPDTAAQPGASSEPQGDPDGVEGGVPGGDPTGVPGGFPPDFNDGENSAAEGSDDEPIVIGGDVIRPVIVERADPVYPEIARRARVQGIVTVTATIDRQGRVVDATLVNDIGMGCGRAALDAVRRRRYQPATLNGRPISVYLRIMVNFQLR